MRGEFAIAAIRGRTQNEPSPWPVRHRNSEPTRTAYETYHSLHTLPSTNESALLESSRAARMEHATKREETSLATPPVCGGRRLRLRLCRQRPGGFAGHRIQKQH